MQDSIYYHKPGHFREFIRVITDKSITVSEALATFREVKCLPNKFKQMTVHELSKSPRLIQDLYETLRKSMQPESKYKLPYNKAEREKQLIDNIAENYAIDKENAHAKVITGHHNDGNQEFNYALEDLNRKVDLTQNLWENKVKFESIALFSLLNDNGVNYDPRTIKEYLKSNLGWNPLAADQASKVAEEIRSGNRYKQYREDVDKYC